MLEQEPGLEFVGVRIQCEQLPLEYRWKYRSPQSAGSVSMQAAGFLTRASCTLLTLCLESWSLYVTKSGRASSCYGVTALGFVCA